jgi:type IV secretory pathway VirB2 component (pilin)
MKQLVINKRMAALALLLVICTFSVAADDFGLDEKIGMVLQMLSSPWVKGVACIALIVECIGLITAGRQEPGMFKKFIPWIAGTILFMAAGTITSKFISVEEDTFNSALELEYWPPCRTFPSRYTRVCSNLICSWKSPSR